MYVFHATLKQNQASIDKTGLLLNQSKYNNRCYYVENQLFFTWISPQEAVDIVLEMAKEKDRKSTRLNSSHASKSRMPSSA